MGRGHLSTKSYSLGEYAALAVAGALSLEDTLKIVATRAQMIAEECRAGESGMLACKVSPAMVDQILTLEKVTPQLVVACRNSKNDCVVSGPLSQLDHFEQICKTKLIKTRRLDVPYGYHSASVEPIVSRLEVLGHSVRWCIPTIPIASNVLGRLLQSQDFRTDYFAKHARWPVRFTEAIESISAEGGFDNSDFVEIGPHPTVTSLVKSILTSNPTRCYSALRSGVDAWTSLNAVLSELSLVKDDINWREYFADSKAVTISLPGYPLSGTDFRVAFSEPVSSARDSIAASYSETGFNLLPRLNLTRSSGDLVVFETTSNALGTLISGHNVGGLAICPASLYHELVLEAAQIVSRPIQDHVWMVSKMSFAQPLIHDPSCPTRTFALHLTKTTEDGGNFKAKITSSEPEGRPELIHFTSIVSMLNPATTKQRRMREASLIKRQASYFTSTCDHSTLQTKVLYERMFTRVVKYAKEYQTLQELNVSSSYQEGYGIFKLPNDFLTRNYVVPPTFTDTLLHTAGFIANLIVGADEICICSHVDSIEILYGYLNYNEAFTVYCNLFEDVQGSILSDAFVLDSSGQTIAICYGIEFRKLRLKTFQRASQPEVKAKSTSPAPIADFSSNETTVIPSPVSSETPKALDEGHQEVKKTIINIVTKSCGFSQQDLSQTASLEVLGIDSLMQIEIASALREAFPASTIDQDTVAACDSIKSLEEFIIQALSPRIDPKFGYGAGSSANGRRSPANGLTNGNPPFEVSSSKPSILHSSNNQRATPVFFFHDGSGQGSLYGRMRDISRTLYAFSDPDYATNNLRPSSLSQMAGRYAATMSMLKTPNVIVGGT